MKYDYIVVGAGLSGVVLARSLAESGKRILLLEKRNHIGGNCYDVVDSAGVMIHRYGAHIFHTDCEEVWNYLLRFTRWRKYVHEVLCCVDDNYFPIPFNFNSLKKVFAKDAPSIKEILIQKYGTKTKIPVLEIVNEQHPALKRVAKFVYEKIFKNYTIKQWGLKPEDISADIVSRVPVYTDYDNRYFTDTYQAVPKNGYTAMIKKMLSHPAIEVKLNTPFDSLCRFDEGKITIDSERFSGKLVYTGQTDALFKYKYGYLPYRSLKFDFKTLNQDYYQSKAVINFPNEHAYTRIIESKHITGQKCSNTTICWEYPQAYISGKNEPYYPISTNESQERYRLYAAEAKKCDNLILSGRLAEYKYYNMDDAVKNALEVARNLL